MIKRIILKSQFVEKSKVGINGIKFLSNYSFKGTALILLRNSFIEEDVTPKNKETPMDRGFNVVPPGIEPGTHGFSVHCSTN